MIELPAVNKWNPEGLTIRCIDAHTEGEPLRVIIGGFPQLSGSTILTQRRELETYHDALRTALMWEPRGHGDMYGCLITEPVTENADFGVLFMHNDGYSTMCGHGIIAVTKVAIEVGMIPMTEPCTKVSIDTPAGLVTAMARIENSCVQSVKFRNVPSYAYALDQLIHIPEIGHVNYDIGFGGAYYAYVQASEVGVETKPSHYSELIRLGKRIKQSIAENTTITHPDQSDLGFLYGTIFIGPSESPDAHSRHVCVFADGQVDRSPTGTGVSGRLALLHAKGLLGCGEPIRIESIIGSAFKGIVIDEINFSPYDAIVPEIEGTAFITGQHTFILDPNDPLRDGFLLR